MVVTIFDHTRPKIIEITFSFPEFAPACKNSVPFSQFLGQKIFSRKSGSVMHNFIWVSGTRPKFRKKPDDTVPRKRLDRPKYRKKDGRMYRPYFMGPFWLPPGVQKRTLMRINFIVVILRYD